MMTDELRVLNPDLYKTVSEKYCDGCIIKSDYLNGKTGDFTIDLNKHYYSIDSSKNIFLRYIIDNDIVKCGNDNRLFAVIYFREIDEWSKILSNTELEKARRIIYED